VINPDDLDAKAEERALAAAEAGCARLLKLLQLHHPEMKKAGPAGKAGTGHSFRTTGHVYNTNARRSSQ
jgi:hypothetical protein